MAPRLLAETIEFLPSERSAAVVRHPFPSTDEVGALLGVDVEPTYVQGGLSQVWEGTGVDAEALPGAQTTVYIALADDGQAPLAAVIIDVARFESVSDAIQHIDEAPFDGGHPAFEIQIASDFVSTASFAAEDGMGGSVIFLRRGSVFAAVTAVATGTSEMETASETIIGSVLDRMDREG